MRKILLVIDEFTELVGLETLFRRLGFDVLSVGRESAVQEAILGFPPDLIIATGQGRYVEGLTLASRVKFGLHRPKIVALVPAAEGPEGSAKLKDLIAASAVDAAIETPFEPRVALRAVCKIMQLQPEPVLEKYSKIVSAKLFEPDELKIIKHPTPIQSSTQKLTGLTPRNTDGTDVVDPRLIASSSESREERFQRMLEAMEGEDLPPLAEGDVMRVARTNLQNAVQKSAAQEQEELEAIAREKREFVRAMARVIKSKKA